MKKAIQETLDIHQAAEAAGLLYSSYKEKQDIECPLCNNFKCAWCPWVIFEGHVCSPSEYDWYEASVARLTSWLDICS
jgi:hypothetical protein